MAMMLMWSCLFACVDCHKTAGYKQDASLINAASSVIHWMLDVLVIVPRGISSFPQADFGIGLGLCDGYPLKSWIMENTTCAVLAFVAYTVFQQWNGADISRACGVLASLSVAMSSWTSPLLVVARLGATCCTGSRLLGSVHCVCLDFYRMLGGPESAGYQSKSR